MDALKRADSQTSGWNISKKAVLVILTGFFLRLLASHQALVVNTDAIFYIQQAKALYYGLNDLITAGYSYLTNYSIFIALAYKVIGDWVGAASGVSILFGTLTLIPLYWLLRRFFDEDVSTLTLMTLAVSPPFINMSGDVIRGPVYWFFLMLGICLFVRQIEKKHYLLLLLSCLSFLLAAWARIEAVLMIFGSALYLLRPRQETRWKHLFIFLMPILVIGLMAFAKLYLLRHGAMPLIGPERIIERITGLADQYQMIRDILKKLIAQQYPGQITYYFFDQVRDTLWFIALGVLFIQTIRTFYVPFFLIFLTGLWAAGKERVKDPRLYYLILLSGAALTLLYAQIIYLWAMFSRWIALFLLPAFVFMGFGIRRIMQMISGRFRLKPAMVYTVIGLIIVGAAVPRLMRISDRKDKYVFAEIGQFISGREQNQRPVSVIGAFKEIILIDFYTHLDYQGAPSFDRETVLTTENRTNMDLMRQKGADYLIWDEANMGEPGLSWLQARQETFVPLKEWQSPKLGRLILYKIRL